MKAPTKIATAYTPRLTMTRRQYRDLMDQLARRGQRCRESGAFILAPVNRVPLPGTSSKRSSRPIAVTDILYYDDLDPHCLVGMINFSAQGFDRLWAHCAEHKLTVVADVHTHPSSGIGQSGIDMTNPMVSAVGHIAIIAPNYAVDQPAVNDLGVHIHLGGHHWDSAYGDSAAALLAIRPSWPTWPARVARLCALLISRPISHVRRPEQ